MIDLHCHILPGLDDGPANFDGSLALAAAALADGTQIIVATPHIRADYRFDSALIAPSVALLNQKLRERNLPVSVLRGAEVAMPKAKSLTDDALSRLCVGSGRYILVESPYDARDELFADDVLLLKERGFDPVLAHPERSPYFQHRLEAIERLVEEGVVCSVTAASLSGSFGSTVRRFVLELMRRRLVHNVASDAHSAVRRRPGLSRGLEAARTVFPDLGEHARWFSVTAPAAILAGNPVPQPPELGQPDEDALMATATVQRSSGSRLARLRARLSRSDRVSDTSP